MKKANVSRRDVKVASLALVAAIAFWTAATYLTTPTVGHHDNVPITGTLSIFKDGQVVYQKADVVTYDMYSYIVCKLFNDSTACAAMAGNYASFSPGTNGCMVYTGDLTSGSYTDTAHFYSKALCSAIGVAISFSNVTPTQGGQCIAVITTNGGSPVKATTSFNLNTNSVTLTASWTASASLTGISSVYLFPYNDKSGVVVQVAGAGGSVCHSLAADTFTSQSLSNGQSLSIQWTFSF